MTPQPPLLRRLAAAGVVVLCLASLLVSWGLTRTAWFRSSETAGEWHLHLVRAAAVLLPAAMLLFAGGVQWALERRPVMATAALLPLPAWVASLNALRMEVPVGAAPGTAAVLTNANILVNDLWMGLIVLQMQGVQPFGGA